MTNSLSDSGQAAKKIETYLAMVLSRSRLEVEFRILFRERDGQRDRDRGDGNGPASAAIAVEFTGRDTPLLLARNAELLHALENVAAKILRLEPEEHDCISFDAEGYKALRDRELARSAEAAIAEVRAHGVRYAFPPMTSRERRMLHLILAKSGLPTASSGEGPRRFVVLYPEGSSAEEASIPDGSGGGSASSATNTAKRIEEIRSRFGRR